MNNFSQYSEHTLQMAIEYGPKLVLAILVLIIGLSVIKSLTVFLKANLDKRDLDPTLAPFLLNITGWGLKLLLIISVAGMVGVETTSFIAVVGAAGLAIGLALQGSLANFAGGVIILLFKPFVKGDFIEAQGHMGTVETIEIFATSLMTADNKKVVIPNGALAGGTINNFSTNMSRRGELEIGIGYNDNIRAACEALMAMCEAHPLVLDEPAAPFAGVISYGDSSIHLIVRYWVPTSDFWPVFFELNEKMKETLDKNNISIPFPQRDVHLIKAEQG